MRATVDKTQGSPGSQFVNEAKSNHLITRCYSDKKEKKKNKGTEEEPETKRKFGKTRFELNVASLPSPRDKFLAKEKR